MASHDWHWEQGNKFALEGLKVLLLINGGGAVALLTFLGHSTSFSLRNAAWSLLAFGIGSFLTTITFLCAYVTQLHYGNDELNNNSRRKATGWHFVAYVTFALAGLAFLCGMGWAFLCIAYA